MFVSVPNGISISFIGAFVIPVAVFVVKHDTYYLMLVAALFLANLLVVALKEYFGRQGDFARPAAASGCDALCIGGDVGGQPGFPSGHMTTVTLFVVGMWLHTRSAIVLWCGVPWMLAMAWARWVKSCHNWAQILGGIGVGTLCGVALDTLTKI
jgi:hypothetical protein